SDLAVGAPETNFGRGGVLLFAGDGSGELQEWVKLPGDSGAFGSSLDASGDWSQDGVDDLLIGAPASGDEGNGKAYLLLGVGL
ncbi:MAG: integrin alpha, partial [Myxococcota bacterium]|nr:integrin alpha [Myxococcota bacterium]